MRYFKKLNAEFGETLVGCWVALGAVQVYLEIPITHTDDLFPGSPGCARARLGLLPAVFDEFSAGCFGMFATLL